MIIKSDVTGCEYDVNTYDGGGGKLGIQHESLHDILVNRLPDTVSYNTNVITATVDYCAAECVISDMNGRKVQAFNDVSLPNGLFQDEQQKSFVSAHPITQVIQSSEDTAVREYLGWPRYFMKEGKSKTVIGEVEIPPEAMEEQPADASEDTFTGMNPPEPADEGGDDKTEEGASMEEVEETTSAPVSDPASAATEADKKEETDQEVDYTIEELGGMKPPIGKYSSMTFDEIWNENPGWFNYIVTTSKNKKFDLARMYYRKKNA